MNAILKNLFILGVVISTLLSINPKQARAELPPEIWHCASQENCLVSLVGTDVLITRKGVTKGTLTTLGVGDGKVVVSNGWIVVTRTSTTEIFFYELTTGNTCVVDHYLPCFAGGVLDGFGFAACPMDESIQKVNLSTCEMISVSANGREGKHMTIGPTRVYVIFGNEIHLGYIPTGNSVTEQIYHNIVNGGHMISFSETSTQRLLFFSSGNVIYSKLEEPLQNGWPTTFYTLPGNGTEGYLDSSSTHVLASTDTGAAWLIDIGTQAGAQLSVNEALQVAISNDTAFVRSATDGVLVFDMSGTEKAYSPLNFFPDWIAYAKPTLPPVCSNGLIEPGETCDGSDFDGLTCLDYGFDGGQLSCSVSCDTIFTSGCWSCGDGTMNPGEACDGADLGTASCAAAGYDNGEVTCRTDCTVDYSQCSTCGNSLIEGAEECEGADLNGETCETSGFFAGTLTCGTDCMLDTSACHMCGDGIANNGELCDGEDTPGVICQTMDLGYTGGQLLCDSVCGDYDDSQCYTCGDGNVDLTEECDGANLNEQDCSSLGLGSGTLSCFENCTFNLNGCSDVPAEYCGNGTTDPGEECDDGNRSNEDDCSETCRIIPPTCGFGGVDPGETCDGTDLGGATCQTLGYEAGVLYCGADCQLRTEDCHFISTPQTISLQLDAEPEPGELDETLMTQYETLKSTLTPQCTSQEVNGDLVMSTVPGSYCAMRARVLDSPTGEKMFSFIYIPETPLENENPVVRFYRNGDIAQNFGGQITAFQGLQVKTVLAGDSIRQVTQNRISSMGMKFLGVHPETQSRGRWLALNIGVGSTKFCTDEAGVNCAMFVPQLGQIVINLDALEDLSDIGWTPPKDGGGCSCQTGSNNNSNSSLPLIFLMVATFLIVRKRRNLRK